LKYSLVSPVVVSLYREASQVSLFHTCEGAACCVDAHLPTVDERFRTCLQWRTYSMYHIWRNGAIKWYHCPSSFGCTRCRSARNLLPRQTSFVSVLSGCATYLTVCLCRPSAKIGII
jgi:hypothetical protein